MMQTESAVLSGRQRRARRVGTVVHYLAGALILLKANELRDHLPFALFFAAAGIAIVIVTALHQRLTHRVRFAHSSIHLAESLITGTEAYLLASEGKQAVQYPMALAAVLLLGAAVFTFSRERRQPH